MTRQRLLERQLKRAGMSAEVTPTSEQWAAFLDTIDRTYLEAEQDRYITERSMELSSRELRDLYDDLKRASETALAAERDKLRTALAVHVAVLEAAGDGVVVTDASGTVTFASRRFVELWGGEMPRGPERIALAASRMKDPEAFLALRRRALADAWSPATDTLELLDGRTIECVSSAIPGPDGQLLGRVSFFRDITRKQATDRQIREMSEERHRFLFDASPLPIWVFDPATLDLLAVNQAMINLVGYSREELLRMKISDIKRLEDVPALQRDMREIVAGRVRHVGVRTWRVKDGREVQVDITSHTLELHGKLSHFAIGIDVTHARRLEDELRQAQKMEAIGRLAGGVAHDFNNILAAILSNAEMAIEDLDARTPAHEAVCEIEAAAQRAASLTRQLLAFSRQQRREVKPVTLDAVVADLEKMLRRILGEDIALSTLRDPQLGAIRGNVGQLEQVVMNLVVNARDAMPLGGRLSIETANEELEAECAAALGVAPGSYVRLLVRDTGCGMTPEVRSRIFEPFFTTKEVGKGTGLGLSTVFGIVRQNEGAITVESQPGAGTTFRVYFPRDPTEASAVAPSPGRRAVKPERAARVLIVEDDDRLRLALQRRLSAWGLVPEVACDAESALHLFQRAREPFDLIMTDLVMPGLDGRSLATRILAICPTARILFMSGHSEHAAVKTPALGPDEHFLPKPFTSDELALAIDRSLGAGARVRSLPDARA